MFLKISILILNIVFVFSAIASETDVLEDTNFGEDLDKINEGKILEFNLNISKPDNGTPNWLQSELIYTQSKKKEYWQIQYNQYERYNQQNNLIIFNKSQTKDLTEGDISYSYSGGIGNFSGADYIQNYSFGGAVQFNNKNLIFSPIFDYGYRKYSNSYSNNYGLFGEKYIGNFRLLLGPTLSDTSIYKSTIGGKLQASYYLKNGSINYYYSNSYEPEIYNNQTNIWNVVSNSIIYRYSNKKLTFNIGGEYVNNINIYKRFGVVTGISYGFD